MLDDINSELLSIYPGTFPNPRPFSKKPLIYNSGFHALVRPPLPLYRVQCTNDYIAEKSKKAEAAIRKLYKAAAHTGSTASFRENSSIFQHETSNETILSKYRESQIYTKSRLRKVNRKQLIKAIHLLRRKEEEDIRKCDSNASKGDNDPTESRPKQKQRSYGALRIENRIFKMRKSLASASAPESNSWSENFDDSSAADITNYSEVQTRGSESEAVLKLNCIQPARRTAASKKLGETIRKRIDTSDGQQYETLQSKEHTFKEEEGETAVMMKRTPLKEGNYTKIVTLKKKSWLKPETTVEISSFPFANTNPGKRTGDMQKVKKDESNNEIHHIYKINDVSRCMRVKQRYGSSTSNGLCRYPGLANCTNFEDEKVYKSDESDKEINMKADHQETVKEQLEEEVTENLLPTQQHKQTIRKLSRYKYGGYKTDSVPHGLQLQESAPELQLEESSSRLQPKPSKSMNLPLIEGSEAGKSDSRYRLKKVVKREERYLRLPQITPTLTIDDPRDNSRNRRNNYRVGQMKYSGRKEFSFVDYRKQYKM